MTEQHRFIEHPLWRRFLPGGDGCAVCESPRTDPRHPLTLKPALNELRAASAAIRRSHQYTVLTQAQMWGKIREFTKGAMVGYPQRLPYDNMYRTVDYRTFITMIQDHWASVSRSEEEFFDCDMQAYYVRVFLGLVGITATAFIADYSGAHAYTMIVLTDRTILYDGGSGTFPDRRQPPKFRFTDLEITF